MSFDLVIKGGIVVDGSGLARRRADVGVVGGRITEIGKLSGTAKRTIDAEGMIVAPGIIDAHTHYDPQMAFDPYATSSCYHGVTTVVTGNCGFSAAPAHPGDREFMMKMFASVEAIAPAALAGADWEAKDFPDFLDRRRKHLGINMAMYVGHSSVRRWVMGAASSERHATPDEIESMRKVVAEAMQAGAAGFTSSMGANHFDGDGVPVPSRFATGQEILALAEAAPEQFGSGSISYLPSAAGQGFGAEDKQFLIDLALAAGWPVIVQGIGGHSKVDAPTTESWEDVQRFFADAASKGAGVFSLLRVQPFDRPFTINRGTQIYQSVFEMHALLTKSREKKIAVLSDPVARKRLAHGIATFNLDPAAGPTAPPPSWTSLHIARVTKPEHEHLIGRSVKSIAEERGVDPFDVFADLSIEENLDLEFVYRNDHADWLKTVDESQGHPNMILGVSDGGAHLDRDDGAWWSTYFLRSWVMERKRWTIEEGIRQITHVPASLLALPDRGLLIPGYAADLFIFDPDEIAPDTKDFIYDLPAGAGRYASRPRGVIGTIVNGEPIVWHGELTDALPGTVVSPNPSLN